ncbi:MAG: hypothetical protein ABR920_12090 [Terriglobales bacterium]
MPVSFGLLGEHFGTPGYFRFGQDTICYGRSCVGSPASHVNSPLPDLSAEVQVQNSTCLLPFDPAEIIEDLRRERYASGYRPHTRAKRAYYLIRSWLPFALRKLLKRIVHRGWKQKRFPSWPVDRTVDKLFEELMLLGMKASSMERVPFIWFWPKGYSGCVVMTHDVEASAGLNFCPQLMDLDDSYGIKSSFQFVPEGRYAIPEEFLAEIRIRGFEINVHDWNHDGLLFADHSVFRERAEKVNLFARSWGAQGFRAGALYRNTDWYDAFTLSYDMSVPNVGHLDPQPGGCCTVMPYFIGRMLEIPTTTTQDYTLFHLLGDYSIDLWQRQLDLILEGNGLASFIVHPDYIIEPRARTTYTKLLEHLSRIAEPQNVWMALPKEVNQWWRNRSQMRLVQKGSGWEIEGLGKEQARVAFATLDGNDLLYTFDAHPAVTVS